MGHTPLQLSPFQTLQVTLRVARAQALCLGAQLSSFIQRDGITRSQEGSSGRTPALARVQECAGEAQSASPGRGLHCCPLLRFLPAFLAAGRWRFSPAHRPCPSCQHDRLSYSTQPLLVPLLGMPCQAALSTWPAPPVPSEGPEDMPPPLWSLPECHQHSWPPILQ